jgi:hypothetical protein
VLTVAALPAAPAPAPAQDYPARPIRIIVGYPPGAGLDFTARLFAEWLKAALGQPTVVENRVGAGGEIAADYVSHAAPDGYTLMYAVGNDLVWTKFLTKRLAIDPLKDLTPIASVIGQLRGRERRPFAQLVQRADRIHKAKSGQADLRHGRDPVVLLPDRRGVATAGRRHAARAL